MEAYNRVVAGLRQAYGPAAAAERDGRVKEAFKVGERQRFLDLLRQRDAGRLALAGHFRVLSFTAIEVDGNHFQSFVLEKPGCRGGATGRRRGGR